MTTPSQSSREWSTQDITGSDASGFQFAMVGGGPNALYLVERILSYVRSGVRLDGLSLAVFDRGGSFGSGCHPIGQASTNHLNRVADQISFGADASHGTGVANPARVRDGHTLFTWCQEKFEATHDEKYNIGKRSWVERSLFGEVSEAVFAEYVDELRRLGIPVQLHDAEVVDLEAGPDGTFRVSARGADGDYAVQAQFVALCTGHGTTRPPENSSGTAFERHEELSAAVYIHQPYPMESIDAGRVPARGRVALQGMGLAALDVILRLTEGRGGYFVRPSHRGADLVYKASGFEPTVIHPFSESGVFVFVRAHNQKLNDQSLYHEAAFFKPEAVDRLRRVRGRVRPDGVGSGAKQLDFDRDILPLMVLETAFVYVATLFGPKAGRDFRHAAEPDLDRFLDDPAPTFASAREAREWLLRAPLAAAERTARAVQRVVVAGHAADDAATEEAALAFLRFRFGRDASGPSTSRPAHDLARDLADRPSPWSHAEDPMQHLFDWDELIDPLRSVRADTCDAQRAAGLAWLRRDTLDARQGNIDNPRKAAIDGVWRDLRDTLRYAVEHGGLTAESHARFSDEACRMINRIAVGTSLKVMEKIGALARHGILDLSMSRGTRVTLDAPGTFGLSRSEAGQPEKRDADVLINARVHKFDVERMVGPLFSNLLRRELVRPWRTVGRNGFSFAPGGVDIARSTLLAIRADGTPNPRLAVLGPPTEGPLYFHIAAARPFCNDPVVIDADRVVAQALALARAGTRADQPSKDSP